MNTFAAKLRAIREKNAISQYVLARRTGLSRQAVSRLEAGEREPSWQTVQLLALALDADTETFRTVDELPELEPSRPVGRPPKAKAEALAPKRSRGRRK